MKPRTKLQHMVATLNKTLPAISQKPVDWAFENCISHLALRHPISKNTVCLDCGCKFQTDTEGDMRCPDCGKMLMVTNSRCRTYKTACYFSVFSRQGMLQVQRVFLMKVRFSTNAMAEKHVAEVCRLWIDSNGAVAVTSRRRAMGGYLDSFDWKSDIELRQPQSVHFHIADSWVYPRYNVTPELRRRGMKGRLPDCNLCNLIKLLLVDSRAETLLKARRVNELEHILANPSTIDLLWPSLKIAIRHKYKITDVRMWTDMIAALDELGKDIRNPKIICPPDLGAAYEEWRRRLERKKSLERERIARRVALEENERFLSQKSKFFDIVIADSDIRISVLDSIQSYEEEGRTMKHCVYSSSYHTKSDSVILSARDCQGNRIETVEFSLSGMKVVQSRGVCNTTTPFHERIVELVNSNVELFRSRITA